MRPFDPKEKRDNTLGQRYGAAVRWVVDAVGNNVDAAIVRPLAALDRGFAGTQQSVGSGLRDASASYVAGRPAPAPVAPATTPVRNPVATSTPSVMSGGVAGSSVAKPALSSFADVRAAMLAPPSTGIQRTVVNGAPTFTGTGAYAPQAALSAPAVQRSALSTPSIAQIPTYTNPTASEPRAVQDQRHAVLSSLDSLQFQLRGKTTRSARDAMTDLERTRAGIVANAGNIGADLSGGNRDAASRQNIADLAATSENSRAVLGESGANDRLAYHDASETERERLKLERPAVTSDREGRYVAIDAARGLARPVTLDGQPLLAGLPEGSITPAGRLASLQEELKAEGESLSPDPARKGVLQQQIDDLRGPAAPAVGDIVKGYRFRGGNPSLRSSWERIP